jgi:hypothetical protein
MEAELLVGLNGQDALTLPMELTEGAASPAGLRVQGSGPLREGAYPWLPTPYEGHFTIRFGADALDPARSGTTTTDFVASYSVRDTRRADDLGTPPIPCRGEVRIEELKAGKGRGVASLEAASLQLDLLCTGAGADLVFGTPDDRVWTVVGPVSLRAGLPPVD